MRLYVRDRRTKMAHFLRFTDKRCEHTYSFLQSQAVCFSVDIPRVYSYPPWNLAVLMAPSMMAS
jgi:hypothetical protein